MDSNTQRMESNIHNLEKYIKISNIKFCKNCNGAYDVYCNKCWGRCIKCNRVVPRFKKTSYKGFAIKCSSCLSNP